MQHYVYNDVCVISCLQNLISCLQQLVFVITNVYNASLSFSQSGFVGTLTPPVNPWPSPLPWHRFFLGTPSTSVSSWSVLVHNWPMSWPFAFSITSSATALTAVWSSSMVWLASISYSETTAQDSDKVVAQWGPCIYCLFLFCFSNMWIKNETQIPFSFLFFKFANEKQTQIPFLFSKVTSAVAQG